MAQPQYTYDPVTQTYTRVDAPVNAPVRGLGPLYSAGDGNAGATPSGYGLNFGGTPIGMSLSPMATEIGVGAQNLGQAHKGSTFGMPNALASPIMSGVSVISEAIGNNIMGTEVSPVANPTAPVETGIAPTTMGLAAMNAQTAAQQNAQAQQAAVANTAQAVAQDVAENATQNAANVADTTDAEAGAALGGNTDGGGGGGGGDGTSTSDAGGFSESDSTNAGDSDSSTYAKGGLASARKTEDMGRGNDTMLVHMTPNEVRGLQAIAMAHGGSLTINPRTGLVEAGFLDSILPAVAGLALNFAVPGLGAAMGGFAIPALVGGGTALMTGSLEKGLMAGLGAYGGANLGSALTSTAAEAIPATTAAAPVTAGAQTSAALTPQVTAPAGVVTPTGAAPAVAQAVPNAAQVAQAVRPPVTPGMISGPGAYMDPITGAGTGIDVTGYGAAQPNFLQQAGVDFGDNMARAGQGIQNLINPKTAGQAFTKLIGTAADEKTGQEATGLGGAMGALTTAGAIAAPAMFSAEKEQEKGAAPQAYIRPYSFDFKPTSETDPNFKFRTGKPGESTAEQRYFTPTYTAMGVFKAGTEPGPSFYGAPTQEQYDLYSRPKPGSEADNTDDGGFLGLFSAGGIAKGGLKDGAFVVPADVVSHLGNGSNDAGQKILSRGLGARPIKGKGDGMSDSIPTTIEGKQPARVADGEAYIPPEVVKKVGAKRLYSMMDKIRHARTGTKRQAPEVDPRKFLPA